MKRISFMMTALLLCFCIGARADNVVTISSTEGAPGDEVTISIGLQNTDELSSLQVSIPLDENLTLVSGSGELGSRCASHSLTVGVKDGILNVFIYSISMAAIGGTSGEVASFKLKLGNQPKTVSLEASKLVLTNSGGDAIEGIAQGGEITTRCAKAQYSTMEVDYGEVPIRSTYQQTVTVTNVGNADLTITDLVFSDVMTFSSTTTLPLVVGVGDSRELNITYAPVNRGSISKTLKVECNSISKLNTIKLLAKPFAVNELHIQPTSGVSDEEVTVSMTMNNMDAISGYQVEFDLPEQFEYVENSFALSDRKQDHVATASINDKKLRILAYSPTDKALTDNDGEIGSFKVKLVGRNGTALTPTKTVLSATIDNKVENVVSAVYGGEITIQSPTISCDDGLNFGAVSVTETCEKAFTISNYGSAPLTVSRIVFDNEAMSIKESFPIVIQPWESSRVTVVYGSVEQTSFDATMHIYSNDPDLRMKDVAVSGSRFAPNFMALSIPDIFITDNMAIDISLDNYDVTSGLQFDVQYPSQYEPFDGNISVSERATGVTVTTRQIDEHTLRCFCYSLTGGSISAGTGKVMTLSLKPVGGIAPAGNYNISVNNVKLGTSELADKYAGTNLQTSFNVLETLIENENYSLNLVTGNLRIIGTGDMGTSPWRTYSSYIKTVEIADGVTFIGDNAFRDCKKLTSVTIGNSVTSIGNSAFYGCSGLTSVIIPNSVTSIGSSAFSGCSSLVELFYLPKSSPANWVATTNTYVPDLIAYSKPSETINNGKAIGMISCTDTISYTGLLPDLKWTNNVNGYEAVLSFPDLSKNAGNYEEWIPTTFTKGGVSFSTNVMFRYTIKPAPLTVKATDASRQYGDENPNLSIEYTGFVNSETEEALTKKPIISTTAELSSPVGSYPITVSGGEALNYDITYQQGELLVTGASITAKVKNVTKVYGDENPDFIIEYSGLKNGETVPSWTTAPTFQTEATKNSGVGEYAIKAVGGVAGNYDISFTDGALTITKAPLTIKAGNASRKYFEEEPSFEYTCTGFLNGDDEEVFTKKPTLVTEATKTSNVGTYKITPSGAEAGNYSISYEQGNLTITKRQLTAISHAARYYGDENPILPIEYTGFVNDETENVLTTKPIGTTTAKVTSPIGDYPITVSGGDATNYEFVYEQGVLTVNKASLSAKVKNVTKVYGDENPDFIIEYSGLKNGETVPSWTTAPTFQTEATKNSGVGEYAIKAVGGVAGNYDISFTDGVLTITKAPLTVSVGEYERTYNEDNPEFKVIYSGFVGDDDEKVLTKNPSATTEATKTSDVGIYPITITEGLAENYIFSYNAGTLTINKAEQSITWEQDLSVLHVGDQLKLTAVASSGLPVIFQSLNSSIAEVNSTNTEYYLGCIEEGKAQIVAIQEGNNNYNAAQRIIKDLVIEKLSLRGDANGDGVVNMDDVTFVTNIILGTEDAIDAADVNKDGKVGMPDVMFIVNYIKNGKFPDE